MQRAEGCSREAEGGNGECCEGWTPQCPTHSRNPPCPPAAAPHLGGVSISWDLQSMALGPCHWPTDPSCPSQAF